MADEDPHVDIGRLRWLVTLAERAQAPETAPGPNATTLIGTGIDETIVGVTVHADVQGVGGQTFWGTEQTDGPISHRIFMRWHDYLDQTNVVVRDTLRPDGSTRREIFRVRRVKELGGRKRFVMIEAELEKYS